MSQQIQNDKLNLFFLQMSSFIEQYKSNKLTRDSITKIISGQMSDWARETALVDSYILFNYIPIQYALNRDFTHEELSTIQTAYEMKYGINEHEQKYFKQISSDFPHYMELLDKVFQIYMMGNERQLSQTERLNIYNQFNQRSELIKSLK